VADVLAETVARTLTAAPWLDPEDFSVWSASGTYPNGRGTFTSCLIVSVPRFATGGGPLFRMFPPLDDLIDPSWITRAERLVLVHADDPTTAYYEDDQVFVDAAANENSRAVGRGA
jgi:hypothetical protein